ncbi:MAG: hypothetical protein ACYTXE_01895 [Nostoc sp.]
MGIGDLGLGTGIGDWGLGTGDYSGSRLDAIHNRVKQCSLVSTSAETPLKSRFQPEAGNVAPGGSAASKERRSLKDKHSQSETGNERI